MADTIYKDWEDKLKALADAYDQEITEIRNKKKEIFAQKVDAVNKLSGKLIQDDERIILSAPEIIIGNVNMGGMLDPESKGTIIIRGYNVSVEGVGDAGTVKTRASNIEQVAENPGYDGTEHVVEANSRVVSQAREIVVEANDVSQYGTFLPSEAVGGCGVSLRSDKSIQVNAQTSKKVKTDRLKARIANLENTQKAVDRQLKDNLAVFKSAREEIENQIDSLDKLKNEDLNAIRTDYRDRDELNVRIKELSMQLTRCLHEYSRQAAELADCAHQLKCLKASKTALEGISDEIFKSDPTGTSVSIAGEKINLLTVDGDGNQRTNNGSGIVAETNNMIIQGVYDDKGSFEKNNQLSINMKTVNVTTAGKVPNKDKPENIEYKAEGDVVITSKNIKLQTIDTELKDKKIIDKGLTADSEIVIRSKKIGLSNDHTVEMEPGDDGKPKKATYKADGSVTVFSNNVLLASVDQKYENGKMEETGLSKDSKVIIRSETVAISATDKEGKAVGKASINAKEVAVKASDVDPKSKASKNPAQGGTVTITAEQAKVYSKVKSFLESEGDIQVKSAKNTLLEGGDTAEFKQGDGLLRIKGGKTELSGSKNTLHGETTINVLKSPSITVDNITISKALKAPNITDGIMVDTKNTSTTSAAIKGEDLKNPDQDLYDYAAGYADTYQSYYYPDDYSMYMMMELFSDEDDK